MGWNHFLPDLAIHNTLHYNTLLISRTKFITFTTLEIHLSYKDDIHSLSSLSVFTQVVMLNRLPFKSCLLLISYVWSIEQKEGYAYAVYDNSRQVIHHIPLNVFKCISFVLTLLRFDSSFVTFFIPAHHSVQSIFFITMLHRLFSHLHL